MSFEFLADMALERREEEIQEAVSSTGRRFSILKNASWTLKARVLSTGLAHGKEFVSTMKNGEKGYPNLIRQAATSNLSSDWQSLFTPNPSHMELLPQGSCLLAFDLVLDTPFYSRDDLAFYPIENPLKRDWVFQAPYLNASGVKGLLRWAFRMCWGDNAPDAETYLFGQRKEEKDDDNSRQGALFCYPLFWSGKVGFEVINPHDRNTGTGKDPVKYEVVMPGSQATLYCMLISRSANPRDTEKALTKLKPALEFLLTDSGISAKRSAGWGTVQVKGCCGWLLTPNGTVKSGGADGAVDSGSDLWADIVDETGNLKPIAPEHGFTTEIIANITGISRTQVKKNKENAVAKVKEIWEERRSAETKTDNSCKMQLKLAEVKEPNISKLMESLTGNLKAMEPQE